MTPKLIVTPFLREKGISNMLRIEWIEEESNKLEDMNTQAINLAAEIDELKDKLRQAKSKNHKYEQALLKIQDIINEVLK